MQKCHIDGKDYEVFVDIFPLDGCPYSSARMIRLYYSAFDLLRTMENTHFMKLEGKNFFKRTVVKLLRSIPLSAYIRCMNRYLKRHSYDGSKSVGNFSGHWRDKEIMAREVYGKPTLIFFEDAEYFGVEKADAYLSRMYGNYMKMPSEEERLSHFSGWSYVKI